MAYFPCTYLCYLLSTAPVAISASIPCRCLNQPVHRFLFGIKTVFLRFMAHPYMPLPSDNTGILSCTCLSTAPHSLLPSPPLLSSTPPTGCGSWTWYYPYLYAPLCTDLRDLASKSITFEQGKSSALTSTHHSTAQHSSAKNFLRCCIG